MRYVEEDRNGRKEMFKMQSIDFFVNGRNGECKNCGCKMQIPANEGRGEKGKKCLNCGSYTVFNGVCSNCGARYR